MASQRTDPPRVADERTMLETWLDYHRSTLLQKAEGLDRDQLVTASCPPSNLTLMGLLRHMTDVERGWFRKGVAGQDVPYVLDYESDDDAEFTQVAEADVAATFDAYTAEIEACRAAVTEVSLDHTFVSHDKPVSLRWVLVHMIEEYARHNGHADLLREAIDGATGD